MGGSGLVLVLGLFFLSQGLDSYLHDRPCRICHNLVLNHLSDPDFLQICKVACASDWKQKNCTSFCSSLRVGDKDAQIACQPICAPQASETTDQARVEVHLCSEIIDKLKLELRLLEEEIKELKTRAERQETELQSQHRKIEACEHQRNEIHNHAHVQEFQIEELKINEVTVVLDDPVIQIKDEEDKKQLEQDQQEKESEREAQRKQEMENIPVYFQPIEESKEPESNFVLTIVLVGLVVVLRFLNEKQVEWVSNQFICAEPFSESNLLWAGVYPSVSDAVLSFGVLVICTASLGTEALYAVLSFGMLRLPTAFDLSWCPILFGISVGNRFYLLFMLLKEEIQVKKFRLPKLLSIFQNTSLIFYTLLAAFSESHSNVPLSFLFLIFELEVFLKQCLVILSQFVELPITLIAIQRFFHFYMIFMLSWIWGYFDVFQSFFFWKVIALNLMIKALLFAQGS